MEKLERGSEEETYLWIIFHFIYQPFEEKEISVEKGVVLSTGHSHPGPKIGDDEPVVSSGSPGQHN
ncbi:unnamed protein product [Arabis nemorensis]|uniref:Uncharacterized protein n=1 Tax=Arabis nemorensis TaxID=586526 RepID=A0A565CXB8_9BRAS|nr:unnamed protein product [Arabis nemorensis]